MNGDQKISFLLYLSLTNLSWYQILTTDPIRKKNKKIKNSRPPLQFTTMADKDIPTRKTISPYDLTSMDNLGHLITQVQLTGENYDEWARSFRTALRARKKFGFIDGTIKRHDEDSSDLEDWWTINSLLVSWIRNTIEPTLRSTISHMEIAQDL